MRETDALRAAWEAWQRKRFPHLNSDDEGLADLELELAGFDSYSAGLVSHVVGVSELPCELKTYPELRARIEQRLDDPDPAIAADAEALLAYLNDLEDLVALARRTHEQTRPKRSARP